MKIQITLVIVILLISESITAQNKIELLSNRSLLSNLFRAEILKPTEKLYCSTDAYKINYYDKANNKLKYIIKYDCNDKLTSLNYSCNAFSGGAVYEYAYYDNNELKEKITYNEYLEIIAHEKYEYRIKSFNEREEIISYSNGYLIKKIILVDSKTI